MGVGVQSHASASLPPGKIRYPLYRMLGGPKGRSGQVRKISLSAGYRSPDHPARSLYADWANWARNKDLRIVCVLDRTSSIYLNKGRPTWWHLLYYVNLLLYMFRMLIHPSSGACDYLVGYCVGCIVLTWGVLVLCSGIGCWACTRIPHHQQPIPLHNTNTTQVNTIQPTQ